MEVVLLNRPMKNPIFYAPGADYLYLGKGSKPTRSTMELWYARVLDKFRFVSKQRFSIENFRKYNPNIFKKPKCEHSRKIPLTPPMTLPSSAEIKKYLGCYMWIQ
jgi:hypothetical protein